MAQIFGTSEFSYYNGYMKKFPEGFYWGETRWDLVARPEALGAEAGSSKFSAENYG